ncbi:MAG TPA: methionine--tRNA ligase [Chloroflexota bacterium]|jgi:methionyl-tRNA synthetase|nr:methionine--tRNA ligase [Chloroflexota bacterium]
MTDSSAGRFYITTAIPYVNGAPHVGHGLEAVQTDALARHHRQIGDDTFFLTGSDDNSITNVRAAEKEGIPVGELVARNTKGFIALDDSLDISYDQFIRTSVHERHKAGAIKLWEAVRASGDIYQKDFFGLYCPSCELFYDENELIDGLCPEHLTRPEPVQENNYFFALSRYQHKLEMIIESDEYRVFPDHRKNEVLSFIRSGLRDFSISRSIERARGWGIPVPGDEGQVMYVWFDALTNYITALDYATNGELYRRYWTENPHRVHVVGKGIIRFHAVYWPAMLLSAHVPLPTTLFVHGYYTLEGRKMSKTLGNTVEPSTLVERYGSEAVRYYFLAATHPTGDGDFSEDLFEARYNADLANDLGNLLNRSISMIRRYRAGVISSHAANSHTKGDLEIAASKLVMVVREAMVEFDFQGALSAVWDVISSANRFIEQEAPWKLAKEEKIESGGEAGERLDAVLGILAETLRRVSISLEPFLPRSAIAIRDQLGLPSEAAAPEWVWQEGIEVVDPTPLFPRIERESTVAEA